MTATIHRNARLDYADKLLTGWQEAGEWTERHAALFRAAGDPTGELSEDNHDVQCYYRPSDGREAILCPDPDGGWIVVMDASTAIADAIERSRSHDEIVTIEVADPDAARAEIAALYSGEIDSVLNGDTLEVWGWTDAQDEDEMDFRVHLRAGTSA